MDVGAVVHYTGQYEDDNVTLTGSPKVNMPRTGGPGPHIGANGQIIDNSAAYPQRARKVAAWSTLDLIASYTFNLPPPASASVPGFAKDGGKNVKMTDGKEKNVLPVSTAEYNSCGWRAWLNNTTITLGMQNVFDARPAFCCWLWGERLRRIACHDQRPVLVRPAKKEILRNLFE